MLALPLMAAAVIATAPAPTPPLAIPQARDAARITARDLAVPFTERRPRIASRCVRVTPWTARCSVRVRGDRIHATFRARVHVRADGMVAVYGSGLR